MRRLAHAAVFAELPPTEIAASPSTLCGRLRAPISDRACPIPFSRVNVPKTFSPFHLIYRSFAITLFLVRFSCRKKARETREKCYFDCESLSFFFTMFFVRLTSIICSIIVKIVRLSSRFVWTENEINAAFLERKYPGFEVIVSSKTNIREREREEPVLRDLLFSFFFFFSSFSLSLSLSLRLQFTQQ